MSHKRRITFEGDPLLATTAIGLARLTLGQYFNRINQSDNIIPYESQKKMMVMLDTIYEASITESGMREHMAAHPEIVAEIERAYDETFAV